MCESNDVAASNVDSLNKDMKEIDPLTNPELWRGGGEEGGKVAEKDERIIEVNGVERSSKQENRDSLSAPARLAFIEGQPGLLNLGDLILGLFRFRSDRRDDSFLAVHARHSGRAAVSFWLHIFEAIFLKQDDGVIRRWL
ncbi:unnamed protein product [Toxocara canis]|uniref:Uncharacterized protein n=1 Tax=Toxocara canis TaxID=6265 RepID=A0A183UPG0_TOXCA|nr:unnamed protein product [Toxocara canis]